MPRSTMKRAHFAWELRRRESDRPLAENRDRMIAAKAEALQRAPGRAGPAGDRRPGVERELVRQRHKRVRRAFHVTGMGAVAGRAVDFGDALDAELLPSRGAVRAHSAAAIVVLHDALTEEGLLFRDAGADCHHNSAGLVSGDH